MPGKPLHFLWRHGGDHSRSQLPGAHGGGRGLHQGAVHCEVNEVAYDKQEFTFLGEEDSTGLLRPLCGTELVSTQKLGLEIKSSFSQSGRPYRESSLLPHSPVP